MLATWKKRTKLDNILKSRYYFANKGLSIQSYGFSSSHVWMWDLDHKEGWVPKNWCFWTVVLEKTLESLLDCKEIQPIYPKGNQSWMFIGRTDAEVETPILWPHDAKNWLIGKDSDAGKDWRQEKKGTIEDEMVGWHHQLDELEFEQALGVGDGQGGLACCSSRARKESDRTEWLCWLRPLIYWRGMFLQTYSSSGVDLCVCVSVCVHAYTHWEGEFNGVRLVVRGESQKIAILCIFT